MQVYVAWNMHEPYPGQYEWTGFADVERWLRLIQACACLPVLLLFAAWQF